LSLFICTRSYIMIIHTLQCKMSFTHDRPAQLFWSLFIFRCFRFFCIYACVTVFLCCYRLPVNKDLYIYIYTGRLVLRFWYWLIQVVLEKRPLTWVPCSSTSSSSKDLYRALSSKSNPISKVANRPSACWKPYCLAFSCLKVVASVSSVHGIVVHGSIFCDPTQPISWLTNPTQPTTSEKNWTQPDPTQY